MLFEYCLCLIDRLLRFYRQHAGAGAAIRMEAREPPARGTVIVFVYDFCRAVCPRPEKLGRLGPHERHYRYARGGGDVHGAAVKAYIQVAVAQSGEKLFERVNAAVVAHPVTVAVHIKPVADKLGRGEIVLRTEKAHGKGRVPFKE